MARGQVAHALPAVRRWDRRPLGPLGAHVLGLGLVTYLGLSGGGFEVAVYGQIGIALAWLLGVGIVVGLFPAGGRPAIAWLALGLLGAYTGWLALGLTWTESAERTSVELARTLTYLAAFAVAVAALRSGHGRSLLNGVAAGGVTLVVVALLSRLRPDLVSGGADTALFLPGTDTRLSYPLNYWNGLGSLCALLLALLVGNSVAARTPAGRFLATAALPLVATCLYLTGSRGALLAACAGLIVLLVLVPGRLALMLNLVIGGAAGGLAIAAARQRDSVLVASGGNVPTGEQSEMLAVLLVVAVGAGLLRTAVDVATFRLSRPRWLAPRRPATAGIAAVVVAGCAVVAIGVGAPGEIERRWTEFKDPTPAPGTGSLRSRDDLLGRLETSSGLGRYDYWVSAAKAARLKPLTGLGPGTFELWWARERTAEGGYVRNAHSLYMETLAESGYPGLLLLVAFLLAVLAAAVRHALRSPPSRRWATGTAAAGLAAFMAGAAFDWLWQLSAVSVAALLLAAVVVSEGRARPARPRGAAQRVLATVPLLAVSGFLMVVVAANDVLAESETASQEAGLVEAARDARAAVDLQPYAMAPRLQLALVLEAAGATEPALLEARRAARAAPSDWRPWLVIARLEATAGRPDAAVAAYDQGRRLNPLSPAFDAPGDDD